MPRRKQTSPKRMKYSEEEKAALIESGVLTPGSLKHEETEENSFNRTTDCQNEAEPDMNTSEEENNCEENAESEIPDERAEDKARISSCLQSGITAPLPTNAETAKPNDTLTRPVYEEEAMKVQDGFETTPDYVETNTDVSDKSIAVSQSATNSEPSFYTDNCVLALEALAKGGRNYRRKRSLSPDERRSSALDVGYSDFYKMIKHTTDETQIGVSDSHAASIKAAAFAAADVGYSDFYKMIKHTTDEAQAGDLPERSVKTNHCASTETRASLARKYVSAVDDEHIAAGDQPLDLSVRTKAQDLSIKKSDTKHSSAPSSSCSVTPGFVSSSKDSASSLASLEEKFGHHSEMFDRIGSKPKAARTRPFLSAFSGGLFSNALYSTLPLPASQSSENMFQREGSNGRINNHLFQEVSVKSCQSRRVSDNSETQNKTFTSFACSCGVNFETLYHLTIHLQDSGHPPNIKSRVHSEYPKLVRGQDMWLNQGSEQTRQILRCMQCGESFKSLTELTLHMMHTKHYYNIVGSGSSDGCRKSVPRSPSHSSSSQNEDSETLYKCRVCRMVHDTSESLLNHLSLSGHYKRHAGQKSNSSDKGFSEDEASIDTPSTPSPKHNMAALVEHVGKRRKIRERTDFDDDSSDSNDLPTLNELSSIRCENCGERINTSHFVEHVRMCLRNRTLLYLAHSDSNLDSQQEEKWQKKECSDVLRVASYTGDSKNKVEADSTKSPLATTSVDLVSSSTGAKGSALKAMESFIETFSAVNSKKRDISGYVQRESPKRQQTTHISLPGSKSLYQNKYLPPLYTCSKPQETKVVERKSSDNEYMKDAQSNTKLVTVKQEQNSNLNDTHSPKSVTPGKHSSSHDQDTDNKTHSNRKSERKKLEEKYLRAHAAAAEGKMSFSALESLQGLVYGKSFNTEHPLDSLQKLIHNTNYSTADLPNGAQALLAGGSNFKGGVPGTVILVNPIVTVMPNSSAPAAVHISMPSESPPPSREAQQTSPRSTDGTQAFNDTDSDQPGEYRCLACKRTFASKGSYRYHLSRCHITSVKNAAIKEAINTSPYVYLPLDHSAKFNKYYEMANELANKNN